MTSRSASREPRHYHLHLARFGGTFCSDHLAFRDRLRNDGRAADAYAALKRALSEQFPRDRQSYINGKADFVAQCLRDCR